MLHVCYVVFRVLQETNQMHSKRGPINSDISTFQYSISRNNWSTQSCKYFTLQVWSLKIDSCTTTEQKYSMVYGSFAWLGCSQTRCFYKHISICLQCWGYSLTAPHSHCIHILCACEVAVNWYPNGNCLKTTEKTKCVCTVLCVCFLCGLKPTTYWESM